MRWRDVLVGAFASLLVTVIGGLAVYYSTREKQQPIPRESLYFALDDTVTFTTESTSLALATLRVTNAGDLAATNVAAAVRVPNGTGIIDMNAVLSSGPAATYRLSRPDGEMISLSIPSLAPGEIATLSILLDSPPPTPLEVGVKSDASLGLPTPATSELPAQFPERDPRRDLSVIIVVTAGVLQLGLLLLSRRSIRSVLRAYQPTAISLNNTAFLYLHQGLVDEAASILEEGISSRGADTLMLANHALCLGLKGHRELAEKKLRAADFYSDTKHERAVIALNRALVAFHFQDTANGMMHLSEALALSPRAIRKYSAYSQVISALKASNPEVASLLGESPSANPGA
jgi:hypothetical protein